MKKTLCLSLLMALALSAKGADNIGRLDTVGGTTWDLQSRLTAYFDSGYGLHVARTCSAGCADRSVRYNFCDASRPKPPWAFNLDSGFKSFGPGVLSKRCGLSDPSISPLSHCPYVSPTLPGGASRLSPDSLSFPPALLPGSNTLPATIGLYPWYDPDEGDSEDAIHLVVPIVPVIRESTGMAPTEVWLWSSVGGRSHIARVGCSPQYLQGGTGVSDCAGRPSMGHDRIRYQRTCAREQFDAANVEPMAGELRADSWAAARRIVARLDQGIRPAGTSAVT